MLIYVGTTHKGRIDNDPFLSNIVDPSRLGPFLVTHLAADLSPVLVLHFGWSIAIWKAGCMVSTVS